MIDDDSYRGWIKCFRKFLVWEWFKTPNMFHVFCYLLMSANRKEGKFEGIVVKRGQMVTGRKKIAANTGISEQSVRTCLYRLKSTNEITIKVTNKYSIITICNYDKYQSISDDTNQQINQQSNQRLTNNQPTTNHKQEDKEDKEEEEKKGDFSFLKKQSEERYAEMDAEFDDILNSPEYDPPEELLRFHKIK